MKPRVRRPGCSAAVTASAVVRRTSRSAEDRRASATSRARPAAARRPRRQAHADRARLLAEEAAPGVAAGLRLLGEDLLLGLAEQVRAVAAQRAQVVADAVQAVGGQQLLGALVVERGPLEVEEQQPRLDRRAALLDLGQQRAVGGVLRVGGEAQRGVGAGAADELDELGELVRGGGQARPVELGDPAGVRLGERGGAAVGLVEQAVDALRRRRRRRAARGPRRRRRGRRRSACSCRRGYCGRRTTRFPSRLGNPRPAVASRTRRARRQGSGWRALTPRGLRSRGSVTASGGTVRRVAGAASTPPDRHFPHVAEKRRSGGRGGSAQRVGVLLVAVELTLELLAGDDAAPVGRALAGRRSRSACGRRASGPPCPWRSSPSRWCSG